MNALVQVNASEIAETVIAKGDLSNLTAAERNNYYAAVCNSIGLNPLTRPLEYLELQGKLVLYARRDAADQLRKLHGISIEIVSQGSADGLYTVHVRAKDKTGRQDEDLGVVSFNYPDRRKTRNGWEDHPKAGKPLQGEERANAMLKAITKAKRRVTLSISGLGFLDETEVEDIPATQKREVVSEVPSPPQPAPPSGPHAVPREGVGIKSWSEKFLAYVRSATSIDEIEAWCNANDDTLEAINAKDPQLCDYIYQAVDVRTNEFRPKKAAKPSNIPSSDGDPDEFMAWAKQRMQTAQSAEQLDQIFNDEVEPAWTNLFPPDQDELLGEHKRLRAKFEPE